MHCGHRSSNQKWVEVLCSKAPKLHPEGFWDKAAGGALRVGKKKERDQRIEGVEKPRLKRVEHRRWRKSK